MRTGIYFLFLCLIFACSGNDSENEKGKLLASVYDKQLFEADVLPLIPSGLAPEDSLERVKQVVDNWIRETVLLKKAEESLPEEVKDMEARLEKHRRDLLIYEFEKEYARQKLDTSVKETEIEAHYEANKADFKLLDYIVKVLYVKVEKSDAGRVKIARWYKSTNQKDLLDLEKYCAENAVNYYNDPESWIYFSDLLKEVPIRVEDKSAFLKSSRFVEFEDEEFAYYVAIYEYKMKDGLSPLSLERENIRSRILNARTTELIRKMRTEVMEEASGEIKNYAHE